MPINFDLEALRQKHNCVNYVETGLYDSNNKDISCRKALDCNFTSVLSIELREDWVKLGLKNFSKEIESGKLILINGDSNELKKYLTDDRYRDRTLFFLDAHVDNNNIHNYRTRCPLFNELESIKSMPQNDNVILIDDLRIICTPYPWGETSYGNINFLAEIIKKILEINKDYKIEYLNGYADNDILYAYV